MKRILFALFCLLLAAPAYAVVTQTVTVHLSWVDNSDNEDGFKIFHCQGAGCTNFVQVGSVAANVTTYTDSISGDTGNLTYSYQLKAFNSAGDSAPSNTASITSPAIIVIPGAPSGVIATVVGVTIP